MVKYYIRSHTRVVERHLILPDRKTVVRSHIRHTKPTFKQMVNTARRVYDIAGSVSDVNTIINGSPKEKINALAGQVIPHYGLIRVGSKILIRKKI